MSAYSVETIVGDVRVALDENTTITVLSSASDADTLEMEDIIKSKIADGINAVRKVAPLRLLDFTREASPSVTVTWLDSEKGIGSMALPSDFLRLALFKMSDWTFGVSEAISPTDDNYKQQWSEWQGVRGNPNNPVVAISGDVKTTTSPVGGVLEFFSCDSVNATATLLYIKRVDGASSSDYDIETSIYRAVVLKIAALVAATYGSSDQMQLLEAMSREMVE